MACLETPLMCCLVKKKVCLGEGEKFENTKEGN